LVRFTPGSFFFYLRHEFRNAWRRDARASRRMMHILIWIFVGLHVLAVPVGFSARRISFLAIDPPVFALSAALAIVFLLMLPTALLAATQAVYVRGDIDLLASSPSSLRKILAIRAGATAISVIAFWAFLLLPFAHVVAAFGQCRALGLYPLLIGLGLTASGAGMAICALLFAVIGPKLTRTLAQVLGALAGAVAIFALQAPNIAPIGAKQAFWAWLLKGPDYGLTASNPLSWPARALLGEWLPMLGVAAAAATIFGIALLFFTGQFAANAAAVAGATLGARTRRIGDRPRRSFRAGFRKVLFVKEWLLLARDPWLISQTLFQVLYLLPLIAVFFRRNLEDAIGVGGLAPLAVIIAGQVAGGLVWLTIAGEDSPDLLQTAPVREDDIFRAKLLAAILPVAVIVGLPVAFVATQDARAALWALGGSIASAGAAIALGLTMRRAQGHKAFNYRYKGSPLLPVAEMALNIAWAGATSLAIDENDWAPAPAAAALALLALILWGRNMRREGWSLRARVPAPITIGAQPMRKEPRLPT
jgi:ABC-2 type transport system permease protein